GGGRRRSGFWRAGFPVRALSLRRLRLLGIRRGLGLHALRFGRGGLFLLGGDEVALALLIGLEVGLVPATPFQAEHRRRHELLQAALAARRTPAERGIGDLLHDLGVELAGLALVLVNGHFVC